MKYVIVRITTFMILTTLSLHALGEGIEWARDKTLCKKVLNDEVEYADFNNPSNYNIYSEEKLLQCKGRPDDECFGSKDNFVNIDIDNDGTKENVVWMESALCDFSFIAIANDALSDLADTELGALLIQVTYDQRACHFLSAEKGYTEIQSFHHKVIMLQNNKIEKVCEFSSKHNVTPTR